MEWYKECQDLLHDFQTRDNSGPFLTPVKWKDWNLPDYPNLIKQPMDMSTIESKFKNQEYKYPFEFAYDMRLIFRDCMTFNTENSELYKEAQLLLEEFDKKFNALYEGKLMNKKYMTGFLLCSMLSFISASDKDALVHDISQLSSMDLSKVIQLLEYRCPAAVHLDSENSISLLIDNMDSSTFFVCQSFVTDLLHQMTLKKAAQPSEGATTPALANTDKISDAGTGLYSPLTPSVTSMSTLPKQSSTNYIQLLEHKPAPMKNSLYSNQPMNASNPPNSNPLPSSYSVPMDQSYYY